MEKNMYCQLWMGNVEPNMTETFIMASFQKCGERPTSVKVMRHKYTGEPAGYAFIHFKTDDEAIDAMHKLNGKPIPGTMPVVRFRLNNACRDAKNISDQERLFSVWVGELSTDVDDYTLFRVFSSKYATIKTAKVIIDNAGFSKGYGFVRFGSEEEQKHALYHLDGYTGLGSKPIKICTATPKPKQTNGNPLQQQQAYGNQATDYNQYYDPSYWQNYSAAWSGYYAGENVGDGTQAVVPQQPQARETTQTQSDSELVLVDHRRPLDIEQMNKETLAQDRALWDALESCKWSNVDALEMT